MIHWEWKLSSIGKRSIIRRRSDDLRGIAKIMLTSMGRLLLESRFLRWLELALISSLLLLVMLLYS